MLINANKMTGKMAQWGELLGVKHDSLNSVPNVHPVERESSPKLSFDLNVCHGRHVSLLP